MSCLVHLLFITLLLFLSTDKSVCTSLFHVGVILDRSSWVGKISWSCMSLAIDDFYDEANIANHTTRLSINLRDVHDDDGDAIGAASAAVDLLKNVRVQAIIGPQRSTQAKFVIQLGNRYNVPIISFSAKSPSFSPAQNPYFIRTAWDDSSQAKVIASIVEKFSWREVVPVFEDTEYGNGIVPYLIDEFEQIGVRVPNRSSISLSAKKKQILEELSKLNNSRTRVFVVHMTYSLGFQIFSVAKELGMMEEGYVWIVTYGLTDILSFHGESAVNLMQGVLGLKPYVHNSEKLQAFKVRWRRLYNLNTTVRINEPTVFGLWAYDTVWALAMAANKLGDIDHVFDFNSSINSSTDFLKIETSLRGPKLRELLLGTTFGGISGKFELVDGQLKSKAYEIINVVNKGTKRIGFWTSAYGFSKYLNRKADLGNDTIVWPGGNNTIPKGWQWPTWNKTLRIGVPVKPGFSEFVNVFKDPFTNKTNATGYCIDVFEAARRKLPYDVLFEYIAFGDDKGNMNGTYDDLVYQVYLQKYDAVVGDVTIVANRSLYVDFTLPYTESGVSMVVPVKDKLKKTPLTFLKPLTANLWLTSGAFFVFTGLIVWLLEHRTNKQFGDNQVGTVLYFSFSTLVFSHKEKIETNLARIVVIIWVFVVWILQSSYTASLTSILTQQQLQPTVTDLNELIKNQNYIGYLNDSFMPGLLKSLNVNQSKLIAYNSPEEYDEALANGTVAAIIDEIPYLKVFLTKYSGKYTMVGPTYKTAGFGFAFPRGSPLVPDLSKAILEVAESTQMIDFEKKLYQNKSSQFFVDISGTSSSSLTLHSFWGLFLISLGTSVIALILHFIFFIHRHRQALRLSTESSDGSVTQWLALLYKFYNQKDSFAQTPENTETLQPASVVANVDVISLNSGLETPSSLSTYTDDNVVTDNDADNYNDDDSATITEDEGTPVREFYDQHFGAPSFSYMLN